MSLLLPNALEISNLSSNPAGTSGKRKFFAKSDGFYEVDTSGNVKKLLTDPLSKPTVNGMIHGTITPSVIVGGTTNCDLSASNIVHIIMGSGNTTLSLLNVSINQIFMIDITQDSIGSRSVTWFSTIRWSGGSAPVLTTSGTKRDCFGFMCTGTGTYDGFIIGQNI